jgi:uncharacterized membrane protein
VLFAAFAFMTWIRDESEITVTEKPMELAFLNAIMRLPAFPADPWLSGYSISITSTCWWDVGCQVATSPAAFNLGLQRFALSAVAYGVVYALVQGPGAGQRRETRPPRPAGLSLTASGRHNESASSPGAGPTRERPPRQAARYALVGPLPAPEQPGRLPGHAARPRAAWQAQAGGAWPGLLEVAGYEGPVTPRPSRSAGSGALWWWRASRVINDVNFSGAQQEVIDEFPFFSFLLDLHPHVLAILVLLAMAWPPIYISEPGRLAREGAEISKLTTLAAYAGRPGLLNTWD